ncbi:MAG: dolichyl-phosphate beta-glucosyltransferase [Caldilineaceae bacterium]
MQRPFLTIVIPAHNEEKRLPGSLEKIGHFLRQQDYQAEVLVIENGSTDRTSDVVRSFAEKVNAADGFTLELLHSDQGKGAAVKTGMLVGKGEYLFICDADLSMPIEEVSKFLPPHLPAGSFDVAIASREIPGAVRYGEPGYRHLMGRVFNLIVRMLIIPGIEDTQCGFKLFTRAAAKDIFPYQTISGWGFDPEVLYIANSRHLRVVEVPINWYYMADSRVNPVRDTIKMFREVLRVRRNGRRGIYQKTLEAGV